MNSRRAQQLQKLYDEYVALCTAGRTTEQAIAEFTYLHVTTLARLKALIAKKRLSQ